MIEGYEMFDDEYETILAKDAFDAEYGDLLTGFEDDDWNDDEDNPFLIDTDELDW